MLSRALTRTIPAVLSIGCLSALAACSSQAGQAPGATTASTPATPAATGGTVRSGSAGPASSAAQPARPQACTDSQVAVTLTHTGALGGQAGGYLTFTNRSRAECELTGWPAAVGITQAGTRSTLAHAKATMFGAWQLTSPMPVVTLAPGDSAYAVVAGDEHPVGNTTSCPAPYLRLEVMIPHGSSASAISAWLPGAGTYLPACATISGASSAVVSDIVPLSSLPR